MKSLNATQITRWMYLALSQWETESREPISSQNLTHCTLVTPIGQNSVNDLFWRIITICIITLLLQIPWLHYGL